MNGTDSMAFEINRLMVYLVIIIIDLITTISIEQSNDLFASSELFVSGQLIFIYLGCQLSNPDSIFVPCAITNHSAVITRKCCGLHVIVAFRIFTDRMRYRSIDILHFF